MVACPPLAVKMFALSFLLFQMGKVEDGLEPCISQHLLLGMPTHGMVGQLKVPIVLSGPLYILEP